MDRQGPCTASVKKDEDGKKPRMGDYLVKQVRM